MRIKLAIDNRDAQIRICSKSRSKHKKLISEAVSTEQYCLPSPSPSDAKSLNYDKIRDKVSRLRSCSKLVCEHKKKRGKEKQYEDEYYKTTSRKKDWEREREELIRENQKLRRENKVLNDYFAFIECKESALHSKGKEKLFSFKEVQSELKQFHAGESKTLKTSITKASSKMQPYEQFY